MNQHWGIVENPGGENPTLVGQENKIFLAEEKLSLIINNYK